MATLSSIRIAKPFSPQEPNVRLVGQDVVSSRYGVLCTLVDSTELRRIVSATSSVGGTLDIVVRGEDGKDYELFFTTKFAY